MVSRDRNPALQRPRSGRRAMDVGALGFLPFGPYTGEAPGLRLEGSLSDIMLGGDLCWLAREEAKKEERKEKRQEGGSCCLFIFL